ncbi:uncharacterized protein PGTG_12589 [Puccinia graminis f. sp. tritici CRL 75-36-700-3]|uniref:ATP-dependent DNA helicase n=1 Tax=Puccinia graminis f. sp. tritici (strain CRL 75-36-700-3 / race SCCL) TaxID=418459 RepID=E3KUT2_PUCGT|nr:uncharacterized protein PGTG_12589 [Puccinia graminis f. sp. tritici CRL 75-36-700-3]EFP88142.1 hypothetical protein PGTG_12589 [Puccinia graminis f. sp. tritici CRL 75-36-700-3]
MLLKWWTAHFKRYTIWRCYCDFWQTLPVVQQGNIFSQGAASLIGSFVWREVTVFSLSQNLRLRTNNALIGSDPGQAEFFADWLLEIGSGTQKKC